MVENHKNPAFRMLFLIAAPKLVKKGIALCKEGNIPMQYHFCAQGTASSEIMDMLGLGGVEKDLMLSMLPRVLAHEMLKKLRSRLHLGMPNTGIAFTVTMSSCSGHMIRLMESTQPQEEERSGRDEWGEMDNEYSAIMAIVNQGFSEEVMNAARPMGASGGTVFHSRRIGSEEAMKFWNISIQQEREVVLILAKKENKKAIMQAVNKECGMQSEARGIVLSLPVDEIIGVN